jgi:hypothetical protein
MTTLATPRPVPIPPALVPLCENEQAMSQATPTVAAPALSALPDQASDVSMPMAGPPGRVGEMRGHTFAVMSLAETVTDIERARIAAENRHRSWVQSGAAGTAAETQAAQIVEALRKVEHEATLSVQRAVRLHPLGPFVKRTVGLGEKQAARLIAAVGDPYWNTLHDRPRTVAELWAYCGFHVLHPGQAIGATQREAAGVDPSRPSQCEADSQSGRAGANLLHPGHTPSGAHVAGDGVDPSAHPGQPRREAHGSSAGVGDSAVTGQPELGARMDHARGGDPSCSPPSQCSTDAQTGSAGVAARRRKGQKANWSNEAKMRARLCAESCIKQAHSPYRPVYDASRAADAGKGLTPLHEHNRALRKVAKALLKDLWREARDWHTAEGGL